MRRMPRMEPLRKMFSLPVSSGWKPVPTSRSDPTRPRIVTWPPVGSVMRERILSSVDLPAPLRPMTPTTLPQTSRQPRPRNAQNRSFSCLGGPRAGGWELARST